MEPRGRLSRQARGAGRLSCGAEASPGGTGPAQDHPEARGRARRVRPLPHGQVLLHLADSGEARRVQAGPLDGGVHSRHLAVQHCSGVRGVRVSAAGHGGDRCSGGGGARVHYNQAACQYHPPQLPLRVQLDGSTEAQ